MKIGWIQCFENPEKWFSITRSGKAIKDGGDGVTWTCGCPFGRRTQPCEHLMFLYDNFIELPAQENVRLLKDGKEYYRKFFQQELDKLNYLMKCLDD